MATEGFASQLERVAVHAKETLADLGYPWALVGGLAVSARAEPRFTRDVDFAVALKSDREAEVLILAVQARGYRIRFQPILAQSGPLVPVTTPSRCSSAAESIVTPRPQRRKSGHPKL